MGEASGVRDPQTDDGGLDWTLYERYCGGHLASFRELFDRYKLRIANLSYRYVRSRQAAEDIAQEVLIKVYEKKLTRRSGVRFSTWVYRVTVNASMDYLRSAERRSVRLDPAADRAEDVLTPPAGASLDGSELRAAVQSAVAALPEGLRVPLVLFEYEEKGQEEIAEILRVSVKTVERRIHRARQKLRKTLSKYC